MTAKARILSLFLCIAMTISLFPARVFAQEPNSISRSAAAGFSGSGALDDPYLISSAAELTLLANCVNGGTSYSGSYFQQTSDILLEGSWTPIGTQEHPFSGTYLGQSYKISGLKIEASECYAGLFGVVTGNIDGVVIDHAVIKGTAFLGAIAGLNRSENADGLGGRITNCQVLDSEITGSNTTGGISGQARGDISGCKILRTAISGKDDVGGIVGAIAPKSYPELNWGNRITQIEACVVKNSTISGNESVGGICGFKSDGETSTGYYRPRIAACFNDNTEVRGASSVGGILGRVYHFYTGDYIMVSRCANTGAVTASSEYAGGIVGSADQCFFGNGDAYIEDCFNTGDITSLGSNAGGICGGTYKTIKNCHNIGQVRGKSYCASICGSTAYSRGNATITNCYYLNSCKSDYRATALSADAFKNAASFSGWDFQSVWMINSLLGAPILQDSASVILDKRVQCRISVVDNEDGTPVSGANVAYMAKDHILGQTDASGAFYLADTVRNLSNENALIVSAYGYDDFMCYLSDLKFYEDRFADNLISLARDGSVDRTYINAHIDFANNRYDTLEQRSGFNHAYWFAASQDTLFAYRVWEVVGDVGEIAALKFDDLLIFDDYYELFITDYLITVSGVSDTLMRDKIFDRAQAQHLSLYHDVLNGVIRNIVALANTKSYSQEEWAAILGQEYSKGFWEIFLKKFENPQYLETDLQTLFDEPWNLSENDREVYDEFLSASVKDGTLKDTIYGDLASGFSFGKQAYRRGSEVVKAFSNACATAQVCASVNADVFQVLYDAAEAMRAEDFQSAFSFKKTLDQFYAIATDEHALNQYLFDSWLFPQLGAVWTLGFKNVFQTWINNSIVRTLNIPGFGSAELAAFIAAYNGTYSMLDKLTKISGKGQLYQIMYYAAPVEAGIDQAMSGYRQTLNTEKTEPVAVFYDLAFSCLRDLNMYLFHTLYDYGALFDATAWSSPSKVDSAAKKTMELATIYKASWKKAACHGNIVANRYKITSVMCPVDVYLYDSEGTLLASVVNEAENCADDSVMLMNCNGKKAFLYPADKDYRIEIIPREDGIMAYSIAEVSENLLVSRNVEFYEIPIQKNHTLSGRIPQQFDVEKQAYALTTDDETILCDYDSNEPSVAVESVALPESYVKLTLGDTLSLRVSVLPEHATYRGIEWATDDISVIRVDTHGTLTAVGTGTAVVTAKAGDKTAACTITVTPPPCTHSEMTYTAAKAPDCVHSGNRAYWTCDACREVFKEDRVTPTTAEAELLPPNRAHDWGSWTQRRAASCTADGEELRSCRRSGCGQTETRRIPASGHKAGEAVKENVTEATLLQAGSYDEVRYCTVCKKELSRRTHVIPRLEAEFPIAPVLEEARFPFTDVARSAWYYDAVRDAWTQGLIDGVTATRYMPEQTLSVAQAIKLAAALHQLSYRGRVSLENGDTSWYSTYVDYAIENGLIERAYGAYTDAQMNSPVTRAEFVHIFHAAAGDLQEINTVAEGAIPDVKTGNAYEAEIYDFYRTGILTGSDANGTFHPADSIRRSEVAAILVRMYDSSARKSITLG